MHFNEVVETVENVKIVEVVEVVKVVEGVLSRDQRSEVGGRRTAGSGQPEDRGQRTDFGMRNAERGFKIKESGDRRQETEDRWQTTPVK